MKSAKNPNRRELLAGLGMFDWQVRQDVQIAVGAIGKSGNRKRPWMG